MLPVLAVLKESKVEILVCLDELLINPGMFFVDSFGPAEVYEAETRMDFAPLEGAPLNWPALHHNVTFIDGVVLISAQMQAFQ